MITVQRKERLAMLCVICILACTALLWVTAFVDGVALATTSSHTDRDWQIAKVDDVFADTILVENAVSHAPITTNNRQSDDFSFEGGVALIPHQVHPLHSGRSWPIAHV